KRDLSDRTAEPIAMPGLDAVAGVVPEYKAKELLKPLGVAFPESKFAASADEAVGAAESIGYPVVMKAQAAALGHKSDAGGVILNLKTADDVRDAFTRMFNNVADYDASITL